jgi:HTH-type transcriptional regulator/antitoxin MqsA
MFQCHVCGFSESYEDYADEVFLIEGKRVLVERIPATRCARCGEATFSRTTTERVRQLVHGQAQPITTVPLKVFAFA